MKEEKINKAEELAARLMAFTDPARVYRLKKKPGKDEIHYAGFNDRVFASIIDIALCLMFFYKPMYYLATIFFGHERAAQLYSLTGLTMTAEQQIAMVQAPGYISDYILNCIMQAVVLGGVFVVSWAQTSATPGKWLLRMRVVDEPTGCRPTQRQFIIRFLGVLLSTLPLMLGLVWASFDKKKQAWHDKMANTVVIKVKHWRLTPPLVSEYPEAVLAARAAAQEEEDEAEEEEEPLQTVAPEEPQPEESAPASKDKAPQP